MGPAVAVLPASQLFCRFASMKRITSSWSVRHLLDSNAKGSLVRFLSTQSFGRDSLKNGGDFVSFGQKDFNAWARGKAFYASAAKFDPSIIQQRRAAELEEAERLKIELHPSKLLQKGTPGTVQGIIKDVMPVGYFVTLPTGKEGYLPYTELNCSGGVVLLEKLFKVGQEITVKVIRNTKGGRDICKIKPESDDSLPSASFVSGGGFGGGGSTGPRR